MDVGNGLKDLGIGWKPHGDGKTPPPGEVVRPDERLSRGRTRSCFTR